MKNLKMRHFLQKYENNYDLIHLWVEEDILNTLQMINCIKIISPFVACELLLSLLWFSVTFARLADYRIFILHKLFEH